MLGWEGSRGTLAMYPDLPRIRPRSTSSNHAFPSTAGTPFPGTKKGSTGWRKPAIRQATGSPPWRSRRSGMREYQSGYSTGRRGPHSRMNSRFSGGGLWSNRRSTRHRWALCWTSSCSHAAVEQPSNSPDRAAARAYLNWTTRGFTRHFSAATMDLIWSTAPSSSS